MPPKKDKKKGGVGSAAAAPIPVETTSAAEAVGPEQAAVVNDTAITGIIRDNALQANSAGPAVNDVVSPAPVMQSAAESLGPLQAPRFTKSVAPPVTASFSASPVRKSSADVAPHERVPRGSIVAVTGASGFIGSHIVQALLTEGYHVRACVRDGSPSSEKNQMLLRLATGQPGSITLVKGELDVVGSYDEAFAGCAAVVHSAAVVDIEQVEDPYGTIVKPAVDGTRNVLASAVASGTIRCVQMSQFCNVSRH